MIAWIAVMTAVIAGPPTQSLSQGEALIWLQGADGSDRQALDAPPAQFQRLGA
jgi:hypothetical protein